MQDKGRLAHAQVVAGPDRRGLGDALAIEKCAEGRHLVAHDEVAALPHDLQVVLRNVDARQDHVATRVAPECHPVGERDAVGQDRPPFPPTSSRPGKPLTMPREMRARMANALRGIVPERAEEFRKLRARGGVGGG